MSYVDQVIEEVIAKNPAEPEFHQAVREVLESLRVVVEAIEEQFKKDALLERWLIRSVSSSSAFLGWMTMDKFMLTQDTVYSSTAQSDLTKAV